MLVGHGPGMQLPVEATVRREGSAPVPVSIDASGPWVEDFASRNTVTTRELSATCGDVCEGFDVAVLQEGLCHTFAFHIFQHL